jgi:hypothetical protein
MTSETFDDPQADAAEFARRNWGLTCAEFIELVTDYVEGALTPGDVVRFEQHLQVCGGCDAFLDQVRRTIALTGTLREDDCDDETLALLLDVFRDWKRAS